MQVRVPHEWPDTPEEAVAIQLRLRSLVEQATPAGFEPRTVAGLDVAYEEGTNRVAAAVVVLDADSLEQVDSAVAVGHTDFPYVSGLFAFRELPSLLAALERLTVTPDLLVCDGQGVAHPRRFGLACHLGVLTGLPSMGVAKNSMGEFEPPAAERGAWTPLLDGEEVLGRALRSQSGVKPVFVSVGHRIDLDRACAEALRLCPRYRLPETTRRADRLCRDALA
ncbi:endonuclease V [Kutzneria viridogrisea]|uniref:Endonuclease V n=2 Tax=Kutzneria TaxID=43356 RepID=W5WTA8_9PSEU|nr:deoxyribonuclease V [Kutzneria albida]AHI01390.1 hypothetical protein KALB_8032 [Kutzneria albida DSM 43870]MBA8926640.1 deoxyribonuclease V [Kutzneria viridogrisea]